jgi:hypothetical protein
MAVVNLVGSRIMTGLETTPVVLATAAEAGGGVRQWIETVEVAADDSANSTYLMARIPSNAVISPTSTLYWDDLTTTGSPTADIGVYNMSGNSDFTDDPDALSSAHDVTSAGNASVLTLAAGISNLGQPVWDYVNGATADPVTEVDIKVAIVDAPPVGGGTMTMVLNYSVV